MTCLSRRSDQRPGQRGPGLFRRPSRWDSWSRTKPALCGTSFVLPVGRVYVALDRDATDRAIALARTFGTHGRVLIHPEELGPKGDLNDWLRMGTKGDPTAFRSVLERALATSPTPWALQIQRLPLDLAPWDMEDYPGVHDLLCELGHQGQLSRDAHLRLLGERYGVAVATLQEAARELARNADTEI